VQQDQEVALTLDELGRVVNDRWNLFGVEPFEKFRVLAKETVHMVAFPRRFRSHNNLAGHSLLGVVVERGKSRAE
jgi:hypothetical protein